MAKTNEIERETLRQAAEAATKLLEKLERDRTAMDERITSLRAVVSAWETLSAKRSRRPAGGTDFAEGTSSKIKRGQVTEYIDAILKDGPREERELRRVIADRFQVACRRTTISSALRRGLNTRYEYEQDGKKWRLKKTEGP